MAKIKLTKGELKRQRDALKQFRRYLPTLQLKKQQLQMEILYWLTRRQEKDHLLRTQQEAVLAWAGLLSDPEVDVRRLLVVAESEISLKNVAGVDVPVFVQARFEDVDYDLFLTPAWVDPGLEQLKGLLSLQEEIAVIGRAVEVLRHELRITTQRVNLFEKVKIPEAQEAIRRIKISIGDQMTNAVGRSKIAKRKIEEMLQGVAA